MTSLFNKYEAYEPIGREISDTAFRFMEEILQQYQGFSTVEVEKIVLDSIGVAAATERAKRAVALRRQENTKKNT